jgi:hypothetical protein
MASIITVYDCSWLIRKIDIPEQLKLQTESKTRISERNVAKNEFEHNSNSHRRQTTAEY